MKKLQFPVDFIGITTYYSNEHPAIDLGWHDKQDEPIYACGDGVVSKIYEDEQYGGGLTLQIKYDDGFMTEFKHLAKVLVEENEKVTQYEKVAVMGKSGWACKGTHLHLNLYLNNKRVNPLEYIYVYPNQEVCKEDKDNVMYLNTKQKFQIGDKVIINGDLFYSTSSDIPTGYVENKITYITRYASGQPHPYNTTGDLGWMNECDIKPYEEPITDYKELYEKELLTNKDLKLQNEQLQEINKELEKRIFSAIEILSK
jgi:hypothetical protein